MAEATRSEEGREPPAVRTRIVLMVVGGTFVAFSIAVLALWFIYLGVLGPDRQVVPKSFPSPALDPDQTIHRLQFQDNERKMLDSYGWVDRKAGLVHIPVDRAMTIIAGRGKAAFAPLPEAGAAAPPSPSPTSAVPVVGTVPGASSPSDAAPTISGGAGGSAAPLPEGGGPSDGSPPGGGTAR